ncbi:MAG TPA: response regulator [Kofleriaceae bacterium]|nr:response regulator [Kofleriaceae bacterium]
MVNELDVVEILLVEDSDEDAELTVRALKQRKLANDLFRVKDGAEALDFIFATGAYESRNGQPKPRVVLLDLKLPKVDGMEVLRRMKEDPATRSIPVVMLTSSKEDRDLEAAYRLGVNSYIVKPVEFDKFVAAVEQLGLYWALLNQNPR